MVFFGDFALAIWVLLSATGYSRYWRQASATPSRQYPPGEGQAYVNPQAVSVFSLPAVYAFGEAGSSVYWKADRWSEDLILGLSCAPVTF